MTPHPPIRGFSRGVALVVTLMMMSVIVMMVVGLGGVMQSEQAAARNLTYQVLADQMAEIGVRQGMAAVLAASPPRVQGISATAPGRILANGLIYPLFLSNESSAMVNFERMGQGSMILSRPLNQPGSLTASWSNVSALASPQPVIGRFSWWVDDEGGKVNLNAIGTTNTKLFALVTNSPLAGREVFTNGTWWTNLAGRSNWIFSTESLKDTNFVVIDRSTALSNNPRRAIYSEVKGQITAWSSNVETDPWGRLKVSLTNLVDSNNILDQTRFNTLMARTFANTNLPGLFGPGVDFTFKYGGGNKALGSNIIRQTLANAYEAYRFLALSNTYTNTLPLQDSNTLSVGGTNVPRNFQGLRPGVLRLNEILIQPMIFQTPGAADSCQLQIWAYVEAVNDGFMTSSNNMICIMGPTNNLSIRFTKANGSTETKNVTAFNFFKTNGNATLPLGGTNQAILPGAVYTNGFWFVFAGLFAPLGSGDWNVTGSGTATRVDLLSFQLGDIVLLQKQGGRRSIPYPIDWIQGPIASFTAFNNLPRAPSAVPLEPAGGGGTTGYSFAATDNGAPTADAYDSTQPMQGISRIDSRARVFPGWVRDGFQNRLLAWTNAPSSYGQTNPALAPVLPNGLLADDVSDLGTNRTKVWALTNPVTIPNSNALPEWSSGGGTNPLGLVMLGKVYTGLPLRTLRFSSQSTDPDPPDWMLAEMFTAATNPATAAPRVNLNRTILSLAGATSRISPVPALLANLNSDESTNILGFRVSTSELDQAKTNLSQNSIPWIAGSRWSDARGERTKAPSDFFALGSELAEVRGVGDVGTGDDRREGFLLPVLDMVTTRSDTFAVWAAGQGLSVLTNGKRTNVMGEVRRQAVFQRVPTFNPDGSLREYRVELLYTRNHVME
jgi:hypothetical protein